MNTLMKEPTFWRDAREKFSGLSKAFRVLGDFFWCVSFFNEERLKEQKIVVNYKCLHIINVINT